MVTTVKIVYNDELHRTRVNMSDFTLEGLKAMFIETYGLVPESFLIRYVDTEGDVVSVVTPNDLDEAVRVFSSENSEINSMKFMAVLNNHVAFQENVVDPILKALEKLVVTLNEALEKVKSEDWRQRANSSVEKTNEFVAKTTQDVVKVAQDARQKLVAARGSIKDIQLEKMLKETQEGLQIAAEGVSVFAQDVATDLTVKLAAAREQAKEALSARRSNSRTTSSDGENTDSETEWEQVVEAVKPAAAEKSEAKPPVVAPPPPVVVPPPPPITKWSNQVKTILDIFPNANTGEIIKKLDESNGNVEVVLNALMEQL